MITGHKNVNVSKHHIFIVMYSKLPFTMNYMVIDFTVRVVILFIFDLWALGYEELYFNKDKSVVRWAVNRSHCTL